MPFLQYPVIVTTHDGKYLELACTFCGGNSQTKKGIDRNSALGSEKLEFLQWRAWSARPYLKCSQARAQQTWPELRID